MSIEIYAGEPPSHIKQWIIEHAQPAGHAETRVKYTESSGITPREKTFNIEGELTNSSIGDISYVEEVDIGNTVTSINNDAFNFCTDLTSVTIPDGVRSIGTSAFESCISIRNMTIPSTVMSIGSNAFMFCSCLTSITFLGKTLEQV